MKIKKLIWYNSKDDDNRYDEFAGMGEITYKIKNNYVFVNGIYVFTTGFGVNSLQGAKEWCQKHFEEAVRECLEE